MGRFKEAIQEAIQETRKEMARRSKEYETKLKLKKDTKIAYLLNRILDDDEDIVWKGKVDKKYLKKAKRGYYKNFFYLIILYIITFLVPLLFYNEANIFLFLTLIIILGFSFCLALGLIGKKYQNLYVEPKFYIFFITPKKIIRIRIKRIIHEDKADTYKLSALIVYFSDLIDVSIEENKLDNMTVMDFKFFAERVKKITNWMLKPRHLTTKLGGKQTKRKTLLFQFIKNYNDLYDKLEKICSEKLSIIGL